jgi:hypothetical protein
VVGESGAAAFDPQAALAELERRTGDAGDGGYALVRAIRAYQGDLAPGAQAALRAALLQLVAARHPRLWGVALEALTQEAAPGVAAPLAALLPGAPDGEDYRRQLLLALLRLRHREALDAATAYVAAGLRDGRLDALTVLAALARVDAGRAVDLGAAGFAAALGAAPAAAAAAPAPGVEGYVPAFASTFLAEDDTLLPLLVARTRARDAAAGATLGALLDAYLARPWVQADLGASRAQAIRRAVAAAAAGA